MAPDRGTAAPRLLSSPRISRPRSSRTGPRSRRPFRFSACALERIREASPSASVRPAALYRRATAPCPWTPVSLSWARGSPRQERTGWRSLSAFAPRAPPRFFRRPRGAARPQACAEFGCGSRSRSPQTEPLLSSGLAAPPSSGALRGRHHALVASSSGAPSRAVRAAAAEGGGPTCRFRASWCLSAPSSFSGCSAKSRCSEPASNTSSLLSNGTVYKKIELFFL